MKHYLWITVQVDTSEIVDIDKISAQSRIDAVRVAYKTKASWDDNDLDDFFETGGLEMFSAYEMVQVEIKEGLMSYLLEVKDLEGFKNIVKDLD